MTLLFILGLVAGSFVGMLTHRLVRAESLMYPRSRCPNCGKQIRARDNIPVVSYLLLRGKCRDCGKKVSIRYPLVELTTAGLFAAVLFVLRGCGAINASTSPVCMWSGAYGAATLPFLLLLVVILVSIFVIDWEEKIIPDELTFLGYFIVVVFLLAFSNVDIYLNLFTGFAAAGFLLFLNLITKGAGMGLGDVKLSVFLGTLFGWPFTLVWMFLAFLTGGLYSTILIFSGKAKFGQHISFGPFLVFSAFVTAVIGQNIIQMIF